MQLFYKETEATDIFLGPRLDTIERMILWNGYYLISTIECVTKTPLRS